MYKVISRISMNGAEGPYQPHVEAGLFKTREYAEQAVAAITAGGKNHFRRIEIIEVPDPPPPSGSYFGTIQEPAKDTPEPTPNLEPHTVAWLEVARDPNLEPPENLDWYYCEATHGHDTVAWLEVARDTLAHDIVEASDPLQKVSSHRGEVTLGSDGRMKLTWRYKRDTLVYYTSTAPSPVSALRTLHEKLLACYEDRDKRRLRAVLVTRIPGRE
jgi:hypothetical protein